MKQLYRFLSVVIVCMSAFSVWANTTTSTTTAKPQRPKIALVLAGGGAKGAAHIGVLRALEELHVPVDIVTGTSMGAYVAGLYATGMNAQDIEKLVLSIDWNEGYRDRVDRSERRIRDKEDEDRYQLRTDLGIGWGEIKAPKGVVQGQNMLKILRQSTGNLLPFKSFNQLVIPYRAVATDIIKLEPVVLDHGYLVDAMMASMSVPGALPPYELDGHWLVDGGVTNNMPVDIARNIGADKIIAVDISTDYKGQDSFTNVFSIADQLSNYLVRRNTQHQSEQLTDADVLLHPDVGLMETTEFNKMPQAFLKGYQAVMENKEQFKPFELSPEAYRAYQKEKELKRKNLQHGDQRKVDKIVVKNRSHYSDELLENRLNLQAGGIIPPEQVEASVESLYALDRFELVSYQYADKDDQNDLIVNVKEKSWGPNYANFRFFLEDDFNSDSQYSIGMSTNFTDINTSGAEASLNFNMGSDKLIEIGFYTPLFSGQKTFFTSSLRYSNNKRSVPLTGFDDTSLQATENYYPLEYTEWRGEMALGYQRNLWREFRLGTRVIYGDTEYSTLPSYGHANFKRLGAFINYRLDTLDSYALPRDGVYFNFEYLFSRDEIYDGDQRLISDSIDTVSELSTKLIVAHSFDRHTLVGNIDYGEVKSKHTSTPIDPKTIGGFLNLSGIPRNSLIGQNKAFASLVYRYRWFDNDFGLFTSPVYIGASVEYGGVWSDPDLDVSSAPMYSAGSLFTGVDSPIGPIMFGYGRTEHNFDSIYLIIGSTFE